VYKYRRLGNYLHTAPLNVTENPQHGLPYDPFKALVAPRPIGWISTVSESDIPNLAPFSFFNGISDRPPFLVASLANGNDTLTNLTATRECTVCLVNKKLVNEMNITAAQVDSSVNEIELAKLETAASVHVKPPRVAASPAAFECRLWQAIELPLNSSGTGYTTVILQVLGIYIDDNYIVDGMVDTAAIEPVARLGYKDYSVVNEDSVFTLKRPT